MNKSVFNKSLVFLLIVFLFGVCATQVYAHYKWRMIAVRAVTSLETSVDLLEKNENLKCEVEI